MLTREEIKLQECYHGYRGNDLINYFYVGLGCVMLSYMLCDLDYC
jgi:hypothetical protein